MMNMENKEDRRRLHTIIRDRYYAGDPIKLLAMDYNMPDWEYTTLCVE